MPNRHRRLPMEAIACRVEARLIPDVMVLVRAGIVANKSDAVERGLKLLLALHADALAAAKAREAAEAVDMLPVAAG